MNLMVCFVGVRESEKEIAYAVSRAKVQNFKIYVVTAMANQIGLSELMVQNVKQEVKDELEKAKTIILNEQIECETQLITYVAEPGEDLIRFAKENRIDEIVIGVRSMSKVGKLLFDSTAQYVILKAPCPVVTMNA